MLSGVKLPLLQNCWNYFIHKICRCCLGTKPIIMPRVIWFLCDREENKLSLINIITNLSSHMVTEYWRENPKGFPLPVFCLMFHFGDIVCLKSCDQFSFSLQEGESWVCSAGCVLLGAFCWVHSAVRILLRVSRQTGGWGSLKHNCDFCWSFC